jgi:hypothetical protein
MGQTTFNRMVFNNNGLFFLEETVEDRQIKGCLPRPELNGRIAVSRLSVAGGA